MGYIHPCLAVNEMTGRRGGLKRKETRDDRDAPSVYGKWRIDSLTRIATEVNKECLRGRWLRRGLHCLCRVIFTTASRYLEERAPNYMSDGAEKLGFLP